MRCISPILARGYTVQNPLYVPCSRCGYCLANRQISWSFRLGEEYNQSKYPVLFITLTYNNENLPRTLDDLPIIRKHFPDQLNLVTLLTCDVQKFFKRLRKLNAHYDPQTQFRYYAAGEYGGKYGRPHYHIIAFNLHPKTANAIPNLWSNKGKNGKQNAQPIGIIDLQICNGQQQVFKYVAGYIVNAFQHANRINKRPFSLMSKKPYLGHTYVSRMYDYHKRNQITYIDRGNIKIPLPRIFKNKIFEQWELNAMKQPAHLDHEARLSAELHRQRLLNGPDWDGFSYLEQQRIYHEIQIRKNSKHIDKYEYQLGPAIKENIFPE